MNESDDPEVAVCVNESEAEAGLNNKGSGLGENTIRKRPAHHTRLDVRTAAELAVSVVHEGKWIAYLQYTGRYCSCPDSLARFSRQENQKDLASGLSTTVWIAWVDLPGNRVGVPSRRSMAPRKSVPDWIMTSSGVSQDAEQISVYRTKKMAESALDWHIILHETDEQWRRGWAQQLLNGRQEVALRPRRTGHDVLYLRKEANGYVLYSSDLLSLCLVRC